MSVGRSLWIGKSENITEVKTKDLGILFSMFQFYCIYLDYFLLKIIFISKAAVFKRCM